MNRNLAFLFVVLSNIVFGQLFTKVVPQEAVGLYYSHNAWLDFDNDGDLDFLLTGVTDVNNLRTILYLNMGNDGFQKSSIYFPSYSESEIAFLNLNGDDRIDILLMGRRIGDSTTNRISLIENRASGIVDRGPLGGFGRPEGYGTVSAGDVNNDGTSDVFVCGISGIQGDGIPIYSAYVYFLINGQYIKSTNSTFKPMAIASSKLVDIDNDLDLDLLLAGRDDISPYRHTLLYLNDGTGSFQLIATQFDQLQNPSFDLADYDRDGDMDILMTGLMNDNNAVVTRLYSNSNGTFTKVKLPSALDRTASGSAKWGDYDNDGDFDILITGQNGPRPFRLAIFQNNGKDNFTEVSDTAFEELGLGYASWGDYDNDGDLDILATGASVSAADSATGVLYILKNESQKKSTAPGRVKNLSIKNTSTNSFGISWGEATDDLTPVRSLTYNLSVRDNDGKYVLHPFSHAETGRRSVSEPGNVFLNKSWRLQGFLQGTYSVKVQAVDGTFQGSEWTEGMFYSGYPAPPTALGLTYSDGKMELIWEDNSINEEYYVIERKTNTGRFIKIDSVSSNITNYSDAYTLGNYYGYRVNAVNPNQRSLYSNTVFTTIESPTGLTSTFSNGKIVLNWTDNSFSERYFVIERSANGVGFIRLDSVRTNVTTYGDTYQGSNMYEYRVVAVNPVQKSGYTNSVETSLDSPSDLNATFSNGNIVVRWKDNSYSEEFFVVQRSTNGGAFISIDSTASNISEFINPYAGFNFYSFRVFAVNRHQVSDYSNSAETTLDSPTDLQAAFPDDLVELQWKDNSYNEQYFIIEQSAGDETYVKVDSVSANVTQFAVHPLDYGSSATFKFKVYATNPWQKSASSNEVAVVVLGLEPSQSDHWQVFPNPAANRVFVKSNDPLIRTAFARFFDLTGAITFSKVVTFDSNNESSLDLTGLAPGLYSLQIENCVFRLIKE